MTGGFGGRFRQVMAGGLLAAGITVAAAPLAHAEWLGDETTLGSAEATTQQWPELSGDRVVYAEETAAGFEIRSRNLKSGQDQSVSGDHSASGRAAVSGWRAVWSDAEAQLWLTDLRSGKHRLLSSGPVDEPSVSGNWACYTYLGQIRLLKISTGAERTISATGVNAAHCDISGSNVVWQERGETSGIVSYDRTTDTTLQLSDSATAQNPRIDQDLVVWQSGGGEDDTQIVLHDLVSGQQDVLAEQPGAADPDISEAQVVWQDSRLGHGNSEVYFYDVVTSVESRLTQTDGWSGHPSIDAGKVAYQDVRGDSHRVYLREIDPPSVTALLGAQLDGSQELNGEVTGSTGVPLISARLELEYLIGSTWESGQSLQTAGDGSYSVLLPPGISKARIRFVGSQDYAPAVSDEVSVPTG